MVKSLDTVFIPSKGRPFCTTAVYLETIGYPESWYIVCGDDDPTVPEYISRWGEHVILFDHDSEWAKTDMMDSYGTSRSSGVAPARNFIHDEAVRMGLRRYWMFDDDYLKIREFSSEVGKAIDIDDGDRLLYRLNQISSFGDRCELPTVGLPSFFHFVFKLYM